MISSPVQRTTVLLAAILPVPILPVTILPVTILPVTILACAVACAAGCETRSRTPRDTLVVLVDGKLRNLDTRFTLTSHEVKASRLIMPGLMTIEQPSLEPMPALAESLEQTGDLTWVATLRPGLRFSDGTPVTARDVAYTFNSTMDPALGSNHGASFAERFKSVEAVDELRVRFHLRKPLATLFSDLDYGIVSARAARERGEIIGAGPYRVVEFEPERRLRLARNRYYHGEPAVLPNLDMRTVADANARAILLVGGAADFGQNAIRPDLVDSIAERDRVKVASGPGVVLSYFMMQNQDPALSDRRVRRAIAHAIDREGIIAIKHGGRATLATGLVPPSHWAYEGDVTTYAHDLERAAALLDEAGYPDPDGPGGEPRLHFTYKTSADQFRLAIARIIAGQLGKVGIEVTVRAFEFGTFFADIKKGNYQLASMQTAPITEPDYLYTYFHTARIPNKDHPHTHNRWRYRNARVDELTARGRATFDRAERLALYSEVQKILARDVPIIPLWHEDNVAVMNVDVTGFVVLPSARFGGLTRAGKRGHDAE